MLIKLLGQSYQVSHHKPLKYHINYFLEIYKKFTENQIDGSAKPNDEITGSMRIVEPPTEEPADVKKKCCTIL